MNLKQMMCKCISRFIMHGSFKWLNDEVCIKIQYYAVFGKSCDLENPKTFNEKLQWIKLYDRNPEYTEMVDKYEAKEYVKKIIGEEYIIPTLGIYNSFEEIDFNKLPNQFVMKCTHDSGSTIICKNKSTFNMKNAKKVMNKKLKKNYYYASREWVYKNIKPRIIIEKYMVDESGTELKDYKFFCTKGTPKLMFIATDRNIDTRFDFFDMDFNHMPFLNGHLNSDKKINKPKGFEKMKELAKILTKDIQNVRVDFYDINGRIYFGEYTFYHWSGLVPFEPEKYDEIVGDMLELPKEKREEK